MADGIQAVITPVLDVAATNAAANQASQIWANKRFALGALETSKFTQPLGRIKGQLGEFEKSLEASNARVVAFGASAGAIFALTSALKDTVKAAINVEKRFTEIATIMGRSTSQMAQFGNAIFEAANAMGQSFDEASKGALELARQGLSANETLKRLSASMLLARQSGDTVENTVIAITAALNSFSNQAIDAIRLVNQLAAVDQKFAVNSGDLAEALKRVGSTANDAGVSMEQLIALVTAAQQTTQRGGAVIGNALKSIFTRLDRPRVLEQLQGVGIQVKNLDGTTRPLIGVLGELASRFDDLTHSQQSHVAELVGGVYQVNILRASLRDLSKEYSFYQRALDTANSATDEAIRRNEELNQTLSAQLTRTFNNFTKAGSSIGSAVFGPAIKKTLNSLEGLAEGGNEVGETISKGILTGLGKVLSGPGISAATLIFLQLGRRLAKFVSDALVQVSGFNSARRTQNDIEKGIVAWLTKEKSLYDEIQSGSLSINSAHDILIRKLQQETAVLERMKIVATEIAQQLLSSGFRTSEKAPLGIQAPKAGGHIPEMMERYGALAAGYNPGSIQRMTVEGKPVIYNSAEKVVPFGNSAFIIPPKGSKARQNYNQRLKRVGIDPDNFAADGKIPNLASREEYLRNLNAEKQNRGVAMKEKIRYAYRQGWLNETEATSLNPEFKPQGELSAKKTSQEIYQSTFRPVDARGQYELFTYDGTSGASGYAFNKEKIRVIWDDVALDKSKLRGPSNLKGDIEQFLSSSIFGFANQIGPPIDGPTAKPFLDQALKESQGNVTSLMGDIFEHGFAAAFRGAIRKTQGSSNFDIANVTPKLREFFPQSKAPVAEFKATDSGETRQSMAYKILIAKAHAKGLGGPEGGQPSGAFALQKAAELGGLFGGFVPNLANLQKKPEGTLELSFPTGSNLQYLDKKDELEIYGIESKKKGDAFKLFKHLADTSKKTGKPIYSKALKPQIAEFDKGLSNYDNLIKVFPQIRYRDIPDLKNDGRVVIKDAGAHDFTSLDDLKKFVNGVNPFIFGEAFKRDKIDFKYLSSMFSYGKIPNEAVQDAFQREMSAGYRKDQVKLGFDSRIGPLVYNTTEGSASNAVDMHRKMGKNISQIKKSGIYARGKIPNLAIDDEGVGLDVGTGLGLFASQLAFSRAGGGLHTKQIQLNKEAIAILEKQIVADAGILKKSEEIRKSEEKIVGLKSENEVLARRSKEDEVRRSKLLAASFVVPFAGGVLESTFQSLPKVGKSLGGFADAISVGAQVAYAIPGHIGLFVGGLVGASTAASKIFHALSDKAPALERSLEKQKAAFEQISNSATSFAQAFDKLNDAYQNQSTSSETIAQLQREYATALAEVPAEYRNLVASAGSAADAQRAVAETLQKLSAQVSQSELAKSLSSKIDKSRGFFFDTSVFDTKSPKGRSEIGTFASRSISSANNPQAFAARLAGANISSAGGFTKLINEAKAAKEINEELAGTLSRFADEAGGLQGLFDNSAKSLGAFKKALQDTAIATRDAVDNFNATNATRRAQAIIDSQLKTNSENAQKAIQSLTDNIKSLASQGLAFANTRANLQNQGKNNLVNTQLSALENSLKQFGSGLSESVKGGLEDAISLIKTEFEGVGKSRQTNTEAITNIFNSVREALEDIINKAGGQEEGVTKNPFKQQEAVRALQNLGGLRGGASSPEQASQLVRGFIEKNNDLFDEKFEVLINKNEQIINELVDTKATLDQDLREQIKQTLINNQINAAARTNSERQRRLGGAEGFLNPAAFRDAMLRAIKGATILSNPNGELIKGRASLDFLSGIRDLLGKDLGGTGAINLREIAVRGRSREIEQTGSLLANSLEAQAFRSPRGSLERGGLLGAAQEIRGATGASEAEAAARAQIESAVSLRQMPENIAQQVNLLQLILNTLQGDITSTLADGNKATKTIQSFTPEAVAEAIRQKQGSIAGLDKKQKDIKDNRDIIGKVASLINEVIVNNHGNDSLRNTLQDAFSNNDILGSLKVVKSVGNKGEKDRASELINRLQGLGGPARINQLLGVSVQHEAKTAFAVTRLLDLGSHSGSIYTHDQTVANAIERLPENLAGKINQQGSPSLSGGGFQSAVGKLGNIATILTGITGLILAVGTKQGRAVVATGARSIVTGSKALFGRDKLNVRNIYNEEAIAQGLRQPTRLNTPTISPRATAGQPISQSLAELYNPEGEHAVVGLKTSEVANLQRSGAASASIRASKFGQSPAVRPEPFDIDAPIKNLENRIAQLEQKRQALVSGPAQNATKINPKGKTVPPLLEAKTQALSLNDQIIKLIKQRELLLAKKSAPFASGPISLPAPQLLKYPQEATRTVGFNFIGGSTRRPFGSLNKILSPFAIYGANNPPNSSGSLTSSGGIKNDAPLFSAKRFNPRGSTLSEVSGLNLFKGAGFSSRLLSGGTGLAGGLLASLPLALAAAKAENQGKNTKAFGLNIAAGGVGGIASSLLTGGKLLAGGASGAGIAAATYPAYLGLRISQEKLAAARAESFAYSGPLKDTRRGKVVQNLSSQLNKFVPNSGLSSRLLQGESARSAISYLGDAKAAKDSGARDASESQALPEITKALNIKLDEARKLLQGDRSSLIKRLTTVQKTNSISAIRAEAPITYEKQNLDASFSRTQKEQLDALKEQYGVGPRSLQRGGVAERSQAAFVKLAQKAESSGLNAPREGELFNELGKNYFDKNFKSSDYLENDKFNASKLFTSEPGKAFSQRYKESAPALEAAGLNPPPLKKPDFANIGGFTYPGNDVYGQRRKAYDESQQKFGNFYVDNSPQAAFLRNLGPAKDAYLGKLQTPQDAYRQSLSPEVLYRQELSRFRQLGGYNRAGGVQPVDNTRQAQEGGENVNAITTAIKEALGKDFAESVGSEIATTLKENANTTNGQLQITWPALEVSIGGNLTFNGKQVSPDNNIVALIYNEVMSALGKPELRKPLKQNNGTNYSPNSNAEGY